MGTTNEMPIFQLVLGAAAMGVVDGPTEVHKVTVARQLLRDYEATTGMFPSQWIPGKIEAARTKFAEYLEHDVANH